MLAVPHEPLFLASWDRAVFIHYEADPLLLQRSVPFKLDLYNGRAFVSIVAFTLCRMRPRRGGRFGEWLLKPIGTHEFLNVRTYVRENDETGIYFLAEWLSNAASIPLGRPLFGLPYHYGRITYDHEDPRRLSGSVEAKRSRFEYSGSCESGEFNRCEAGSLTEFVVERYTAFTSCGRTRRLFHVWHPPWPQAAAGVTVRAGDLVATTGEWWRTASYLGANYSPGVPVWMGRPLRIR
jgi:uncharacterized protein YqjF (DUF2071 family)